MMSLNKYKYFKTDLYESKDGRFYFIHNNETIAYSHADMTK